MDNIEDSENMEMAESRKRRRRRKNEEKEDKGLSPVKETVPSVSGKVEEDERREVLEKDTEGVV